MKRFVIAILAGLIGAALLPQAADAGKAKQQHVEGSIALPAPFYGEAQGTNACWGGMHRRVITVGQGNPQGLVGYHFDIDKATWNKPFVLEPTGGMGTVDLDLFLYLHMPPLDEVPNDPVNFGTPVSVDFLTREAGGEHGIVPPNTVKAIVCLYGGTFGGYAGANATFEYTAGKGVKLPKD